MYCSHGLVPTWWRNAVTWNYLSTHTLYSAHYAWAVNANETRALQSAWVIHRANIMTSPSTFQALYARLARTIWSFHQEDHFYNEQASVVFELLELHHDPFILVDLCHFVIKHFFWNDFLKMKQHSDPCTQKSKYKRGQIKQGKFFLSNTEIFWVKQYEDRKKWQLLLVKTTASIGRLITPESSLDFSMKVLLIHFSFLVGFHLESNVYGEGKISRLALDFRSKLPLSFAEHSDTFRSTNHRRAAIEIGVFHQIGKGCQLHSNATK